MAGNSYGYVQPRFGQASSGASSLNQMARLLGQTKRDPASLFNSDPFGLTGSAAPAGAAGRAPTAARVASYTTPAQDNGSPDVQNQAPAQTNAKNTPDASQISFDYSADPVLLNVEAAGIKSRQQARDAALEAEKQLAVRYGNSDFARSVLGDTLTASAAAGNPDSVFARLKQQYDQGANTLDQQLNQHNLFYGGERAKQQGLLGENYRQARSDATSQFQTQAQQIRDQLGQALAGFDAQDRQAEADAYARALQLALAGGYGTDTSQSSDSPIMTEQPANTEATFSGSPAPSIPLQISGLLPAIPNYTLGKRTGVPLSVSGTLERILAPNAYNRKTTANLR